MIGRGNFEKKITQIMITLNGDSNQIMITKNHDSQSNDRWSSIPCWYFSNTLQKRMNFFGILDSISLLDALPINCFWEAQTITHIKHGGEILWSIYENWIVDGCLKVKRFRICSHPTRWQGWSQTDPVQKPFSDPSQSQICNSWNPMFDHPMGH